MLCYRTEGVKCTHTQKTKTKKTKGENSTLTTFFFTVVYPFITPLAILYICLNFRVKLYGVVDKLMDISLETYANA